MKSNVSRVAVVGDCHGHLQLALCVLARWQQEANVRFEAVFLCGDVGTFTEEFQLDNATHRHARKNPCELEFLTQWASQPPAPWLAYIFKPLKEGGLGLECPVVMVHGNHEGFDHLERLVPSGFPREPVPLDALPGVDPDWYIRLLPSGWQAVTPSGCRVAGVGGIERHQRKVRYHPMAYIDEDAVARLLNRRKVDLLLTHQGPSEVQGDHGSETLQLLLDDGIASAWFHGHSTPNFDVVRAGLGKQTQVVPLGDITFPGRGREANEPGRHGWAMVTVEEDRVSVEKTTPSFLRDFRMNHWIRTIDGRLISPSLAEIAWQLGVH